MKQAGVDCFANNAFFRREERPDRVVLWRRTEESPALHDCVADLEGALAQATLVKDTRSTKAGILRLADGREVFIKRYNYRGLRHSLRYLFRRARPFRAWAAAWACEQGNVPTPRPLAAVVGKRAGLLREAWLICAAVPRPVPTLVYARRLLRQPPLLRDFADATCAMLASMHAAGIRHGDPKLSNLYAIPQDRDHSYGLWDLDAAELGPGPLPIAARTAEVARLAASLVEIAVRLGLPLPPETAAGLFAAAYARAAGTALDPAVVLKLVWRHLRR